VAAVVVGFTGANRAAGALYKAVGCPYGWWKAFFMRTSGQRQRCSQPPRQGPLGSRRSGLCWWPVKPCS